MKKSVHLLKLFLLAAVIVFLPVLPAFATTYKTNFHDYLQAYYSKRYSVGDATMGGNVYEQALLFNTYNGVAGEADFNLEGHFKSMTFYTAHADSTSSLSTRTVRIYTDDNLAYELEVKNGDLPVQGSITLSGVKQLRICVDGSGYYNTCIGGIQIVNDGYSREQKLQPITSNLLKNVTPYNSTRYSTTDQINMCDKIWENPLCFNTYNGVTAYANFNLEGYYKQLSFYVGNESASDASDRKLTIYGDNGKVLYTNTINYNQIMMPVKVDVTGVHQLKIEVGPAGYFQTVLCGANLVSDGIVRSVSLDQAALILDDNNKSAYLLATIVPEDAANKNLVWTSSDEDVATVSVDGLVTGTGPGECTITVKTVSGGYTAQCQVNSSVTKIEKISNTITASDLTLTAKKKIQTATLKASAEGGAELRYTSNNKSVNVSSTGTITVAKEFTGIAVITINSAETDRYNAATKKIKVKVSPEKPVLTVKSSKKGQITVKWTPQKNVSGYQIQYSLNSGLKNAAKKNISKAKAKTATLKKLKAGKKYYVRIRSYVKVGKEVLYSQWNKKSVKVKK